MSLRDAAQQTHRQRDNILFAVRESDPAVASSFCFTLSAAWTNQGVSTSPGAGWSRRCANHSTFLFNSARSSAVRLRNSVSTARSRNLTRSC
jgi:hypothetical protein